MRVDLLDDPALPNLWGQTDAEMENTLTRYLNEAMKFMTLRKIKSDPSFYTDTGTMEELGLVTGTLGNWITVDLPEYILSIRKIEMRESAFPESNSKVEYAHLVETDGTTLFGGLRIPHFRGTRFTILGRRRIGFTGNPENVDFRFYFVRRQPDLVRFTAGATSNDERADVDVTTDATRGALVGRPDYYVGARVQCISADDAAPQEEIRDVSSYAANAAYPDFRMSFSQAFTAALADGDVLEVIPSFEDEYHELLAYLAVQRAYHREGEISNQIASSETVKQLWQQFLSSGERRQTASCRVPWFDRTV